MLDRHELLECVCMLCIIYCVYVYTGRHVRQTRVPTWVLECFEKIRPGEDELLRFLLPRSCYRSVTLPDLLCLKKHIFQLNLHIAILFIGLIFKYHWYASLLILCEYFFLNIFCFHKKL